MPRRNQKQKTLLFSFLSVSVILLAIGMASICVALILQVAPINPYSIDVTISGVRQPPTMETVARVRVIFLYIFGLTGLQFGIPGALCLRYVIMRRKIASRLKEEGIRITAKAVASVPSRIYKYTGRTLSWGIGISIFCRGRSWWCRWGHRHLVRLHCSYQDSASVFHQFKSDFLQADPLPRLPGGTVTVYCDREKFGCYFVDVDGSIEVDYGDAVKV